jgi:hypothetical protein
MTDFLAGNIAATCHPKVRELTDYWLSIHPAKGLPGRQHLEPSDIPKLLSNIFLVDIDSRAPRFTWRLMGTTLATIFNRDCTGLPFEAAYRAGTNSNAYRAMIDMIQTKQARWRRGSALFMRDRDYLMMERAIFPLARDGDTVDMAVGIILAQTEGREAI